MPAWKTKTTTSEGLPLILRFVADLNPDLYSPEFKELAVLVHNLSKISDNGLPDADYNDGLISFDKELRNAVEMNDQGITVLVETFAGKRRYYVYLKEGIELNKALADCRNSYPNENLTWTIHDDPHWDFIKKYRLDVIKE